MDHNCLIGKLQREGDLLEPSTIDPRWLNLTLHQRRVYQLLSRVPRGKITTYGELARALGNRGARAVGNTLNRNPFAPTVPCHRVVQANGALGGYAGGVSKKIALLHEEGIEVVNGKIRDFDRKIYSFTQRDVARAAALVE